MPELRIKEWREKRRLSQRDLAKRAGLSPMTVYRLETGQHHPQTDTLELLAKALGVSIRLLFAKERLVKGRVSTYGRKRSRRRK